MMMMMMSTFTGMIPIHLNAQYAEGRSEEVCVGVWGVGGGGVGVGGGGMGNREKVIIIKIKKKTYGAKSFREQVGFQKSAERRQGICFLIVCGN